MSELFKSLFKLQGAIRGVKRDAKNPHFKNSYATLEQVEDTIRPHMQENGLVWFQLPGRVVDGSIEVTTVIVHAETGEEIRGTMEMPLAKRDPQGAGSALTYAQRYSLMAILGLPPTDDDAETAIDRNHSRAEPEAPAKSSAQLKRDGEWERVTRQISEDMADVFTFAAFENLKNSYRAEAKRKGWNTAFNEALKDHFAGLEEEVQRRVDADNTFPGDTNITNTAGRRLHSMEA